MDQAPKFFRKSFWPKRRETMSTHLRYSNVSPQNKKRKREGNELRLKSKGDRKCAVKKNEDEETNVMNADQLAWKKISLQNDEFDDFEEIEGVDVDYVDKDGSKVIQFKVRRYSRLGADGVQDWEK